MVDNALCIINGEMSCVDNTSDSACLITIGGFYKLLYGDFEDFVRQIDDLNEGAVRAL
mgnify:CR=1 FL=1